jgi:hypothetical protein
MTSDEKEAALNRHRFLVQTKVISEEVYDRILQIPQADRGDEVSPPPPPSPPLPP